eukprot:Awhi_evm4s10906
MPMTSDWTPIRTMIAQAGQCDNTSNVDLTNTAACKHCGVCQLLNQLIMKVEAMILDHYQLEFDGATGQVSYDSLGDRTLDGIYFEILNSRMDATGETAMKQAGHIVMTDITCTDINLDNIDVILASPLQYAGSTFTTPVVVPVIDTLPTLSDPIPLAYRIS